MPTDSLCERTGWFMSDSRKREAKTLSPPRVQIFEMTTLAKGSEVVAHRLQMRRIPCAKDLLCKKLPQCVHPTSTAAPRRNKPWQRRSF